MCSVPHSRVSHTEACVDVPHSPDSVVTHHMECAPCLWRFNEGYQSNMGERDMSLTPYTALDGSPL